MVLATYPKVAELAKLSEAQGFKFNGENQIVSSDSSGFSVSGAGDINGDGLNDFNEKTTRAYITAIQILLDELQKQSVDLDLEKISLDHQQQLFNEIIKQTRLHTLPKKNCATTASATLCHFFKPEVTPVEIENKAHAIAEAIERDNVT